MYVNSSDVLNLRTKMEVNKIVVRLGKDYYKGFFWLEPSKKGNQEIYVSYEGIRKKQLIKLETKDKQRKIAEEMLFKLLNEL
jgi:hypothetical protein